MEVLITFEWHINYIMTPIDGAEPHVERTTTTFSGAPPQNSDCPLGTQWTCHNAPYCVDRGIMSPILCPYTLQKTHYKKFNYSAYITVLVFAHDWYDEMLACEIGRPSDRCVMLNVPSTFEDLHYIIIMCMSHCNHHLINSYYVLTVQYNSI